MKQDYTEIVVILDRSGSMQQGRDDHEGGLQSFVQDQETLPGDVRLTLIQFDTVDPCEILYDGVPIAEVKDIRLIPRGGTPLLDAVGLAIAHVAERLKDASPDQVVVMIITDGQENASREYKRDQIQKMIAEYESRGWKFLYLGADVDAFEEAQGLAIGGAAALHYHKSPQGIHNAYLATSANMKLSRERLQADADRDEAFDAFDYSPEQRKAAEEE